MKLPKKDIEKAYVWTKRDHNKVLCLPMEIQVNTATQPYIFNNNEEIAAHLAEIRKHLMNAYREALSEDVVVVFDYEKTEIDNTELGKEVRKLYYDIVTSSGRNTLTTGAFGRAVVDFIESDKWRK